RCRKSEVEGAVLANHRVHRPKPGDEVAPAGGAPGNRHHLDAGAVELLEGLVGCGRETPIGRERVIYVREDKIEMAKPFRSERLERPDSDICARLMNTFHSLSPAGSVTSHFVPHPTSSEGSTTL